MSALRYPEGVNMADSARPENQTERLLSRFRDLYPVLEEFYPLASGVDRQLVEGFPQQPSWRVIAALRRHVLDPRYLRAVADGEFRYSLDGQRQDPVCEGHREHALLRLSEMEQEDNSGPAEEDLSRIVYRGARFVLLQQVSYLYGQQTAQQTAELLSRPLERGQIEDLARRLVDQPDSDSWLGRVAEMAGVRAS